MFNFINFIDFILSLITNPKKTLLSLFVCGSLMGLFLALWSGDEKLIIILCGILGLLVLYGIIRSIMNSKTNTEKWLKVIRIVALAILVFLCYKVESQTVLYVYLGILGILFIYTLRIVVSGKIKENKNNYTKLKENYEDLTNSMKGLDKGL